MLSYDTWELRVEGFRRKLIQQSRLRQELPQNPKSHPFGPSRALGSFLESMRGFGVVGAQRYRSSGRGQMFQADVPREPNMV